MARLEVSDLSFTYPGAQNKTLEEIEFAVPSGGSLALLGSSGAGKTTLLNLLSGLLPCTDGRILFDGEDFAARPASERRVAQVFQFPVMYESLSVSENISFPLRRQGVGRAQRRTRAAALADLFDLADVVDRKPRELSLFQKQLAGFAKALVRDDLVMVLLDEPLTAVEPAMKWRLRSAVKAAQAELGVTMVYVTHDQTEALTFADEVSVLHGGRLLQTDSPKTLFEKPAHVEVARFIGNPGMNVVDLRIADDAISLGGHKVSGRMPSLPPGRIQLGFRPEWAQLVSKGRHGEFSPDAISVPVTLLSTHLRGVDAGLQTGLAKVVVGDTVVQVDCVLGAHLDAPLVLQLDRYMLFCDGLRVEGGSLL